MELINNFKNIINNNNKLCADIRDGRIVIVHNKDQYKELICLCDKLLLSLQRNSNTSANIVVSINNMINTVNWSSNGVPDLVRNNVRYIKEIIEELEAATRNKSYVNYNDNDIANFNIEWNRHYVSFMSLFRAMDSTNDNHSSNSDYQWFMISTYDLMYYILRLFNYKPADII